MHGATLNRKEIYHLLTIKKEGISAKKQVQQDDI